MDFLKVTIRRNPKLIKASVKLHQEGIIPPNTIVIDLDTIKDNAHIIKATADEYKVKNLFYDKTVWA
jgi:predicted amino acid racemase